MVRVTTVKEVRFVLGDAQSVFKNVVVNPVPDGGQNPEPSNDGVSDESKDDGPRTASPVEVDVGGVEPPVEPATSTGQDLATLGVANMLVSMAALRPSNADSVPADAVAVVAADSNMGRRTLAKRGGRGRGRYPRRGRNAAGPIPGPFRRIAPDDSTRDAPYDRFNNVEGQLSSLKSGGHCAMAQTKALGLTPYNIGPFVPPFNVTVSAAQSCRPIAGRRTGVGRASTKSTPEMDVVARYPITGFIRQSPMGPIAFGSTLSAVHGVASRDPAPATISAPHDYQCQHLPPQFILGAHSLFPVKDWLYNDKHAMLVVSVPLIELYNPPQLQQTLLYQVLEHTRCAVTGYRCNFECPVLMQLPRRQRLTPRQFFYTTHNAPSTQ